MPPEVLLTPREAAAWLKVSVATLRGWRKLGKGPTVVRLSRRTYRYTEDCIRQYIETTLGQVEPKKARR